MWVRLRWFNDCSVIFLTFKPRIVQQLHDITVVFCGFSDFSSIFFWFHLDFSDRQVFIYPEPNRLPLYVSLLQQSDPDFVDDVRELRQILLPCCYSKCHTERKIPNTSAQLSAFVVGKAMPIGVGPYPCVDRGCEVWVSPIFWCWLQLIDWLID